MSLGRELSQAPVGCLSGGTPADDRGEQQTGLFWPRRGLEGRGGSGDDGDACVDDLGRGTGPVLKQGQDLAGVNVAGPGPCPICVLNTMMSRATI